MTLLALLLTLFATKSAAATGPLSMAASTQKKILVVRVGGSEARRYDIAVGTKAHQTPNGRFTVRHLIWNPSWVPPKEKWAKGKQPTPPGHPRNPMRGVKIFFQEPDYYIHGTNDEESIGSAASHGCIRMSEADATELARYLMDQSGLKKPDSWYDGVAEAGKPVSVQLPTGVPFAIGK
ncbi:MAG TPA: L,D-transpeptidase [Thermoanaerobaculia bacterium]|jgi:lipoprotein-anchoring transpeptidase ErfK/SrfK|nr:L,D-transpeptidase [Thermoanaerobaculia bacterium]